jgi:signal transduction histidine kinase
VDPEWVTDLAHELGETVKTFELEAKAKGIGMSVSDVDALPAVRWDMRRIRYHVLNNIISNALKFTPSGGRVSLSAEASDNAVKIRISDTGPGIPPKEQQKIFRRFEQADMDSHRVFKGAGLGLHNARLFVTQHGGRICVESSTGRGTTILIDLPLDAAMAHPQDG